MIMMIRQILTLQRAIGLSNISQVTPLSLTVRSRFHHSMAAAAFVHGLSRSAKRKVKPFLRVEEDRTIKPFVPGLKPSPAPLHNLLDFAFCCAIIELLWMW